MKRIFILIFFLTFIFGCQKGKSIPPALYVLFSELRGGEVPSPPSDVYAVYQPVLKKIEVRFRPADTSSTLIYRIYVYYTETPEHFYQKQNLVKESASSPVLIDAKPFSGTLYFRVTSYNGQNESLPSKVAPLSLNLKQL